MDPFTERILERARERQRKLLECNGDETKNTPLKEVNNLKAESMPQISSTHSSKLEHEKYKLMKDKSSSDFNIGTKTEQDCLTLITGTNSEGNLHKFLRNNSKTLISSDVPGSPQSQLKTLNIKKDNFNMEIKVSSTENVRLEVQFQEEEEEVDYTEEKENFQTSQEELQNEDSQGEPTAPIIRENAKRRLQQLGKLYAGGEDADISSPIHRTEPEFLAECKHAEKSAKSVVKSQKGLGGLAALAQSMNEWEDNTTKTNSNEHKSTNRSWKSPAPRPPISSVRTPLNLVEQKPKKLKSQAPKPPVDTSTKVNVNDCTEEKPQQLNLDPSLLKTLESQGYTRTSSKSRLIYNYNSQNLSDDIKRAEISTPPKLGDAQNNCILEEPEENTKINKITNNVSSPSKSKIKGSAVASRAAIFENASSPNKTNSNTKDPALLSVSERKALFEKHKGAIPVPKAPISMAAPLNIEKSTQKTQKQDTSPIKTTPAKYPAPRPPIRANDNVDSAYRVPPGQPGGIASKMAALFQNITTISQQQIENNTREQRKKEMDVLLNRFQRNKGAQGEQIHHESFPESDDDDEEADETSAMIQQKPAEILRKFEGLAPPPPPLPGNSSGQKRRSKGRRCSTEDSPKVAAVLEDVKRIKVSPSKPGRLYPCLSDIETATETETEHNTANPSLNSSYEENSYESNPAETSFGREILETVCKNQSGTSQKRSIYDDSTESDLSNVLDDMDDYLDEAMAYNAENGPTPPKQGRSASPEKCVSQVSSSFQYKNFSPYKEAASLSEFKSPLKTVADHKPTTELPAYIVDGDNLLPLTHTISFYRKQQNQASNTPVRQMTKQSSITEEGSEKTEQSADENNEAKLKIQELIKEMTKQQTIISQTSQALNLCYSTPEFTGSTEQVEAERVLLLATQRRAAAQREVERLTVLKTLHPHTDSSVEKGTLTISNIILPLKREYVRALNATGGKGHHIVCLIKCADQVLCTKLVSTVAINDPNPDLELHIPGTIILNNIYSDFTVQFEVYCLRAQEEVLPHEVKYHINNKKLNKTTPKKSKMESRMIRPPKESPGGPQAVRSPTFSLMGYVIFSIQAVNRKNWTLNNAPSMSPLEGIVEMRVKCELQVSIKHHGFLTMFEDISGFGAWHRRWCLLKGNILSYWKYPDDEKKKAPIDTINLKDCVSKQVGLVRRDICARPNTILIETTRPSRSNDQNSLVMECNGDSTIIRHLLAADTKEERIEWCTMFNKSLSVARVNECSK